MCFAHLSETSRVYVLRRDKTIATSVAIYYDQPIHLRRQSRRAKRLFLVFVLALLAALPATSWAQKR